MSEPFWIVWAPQGERPPRVRHSQEHLAEAEAMRLARENPGHDFIVMQSVVRIKQPVKMELEHYSDPGVPF